jgi:UDP-N-acetylglucosamine:LPS N-acetylglucosamine transferase
MTATTPAVVSPAPASGDRAPSRLPANARVVIISAGVGAGHDGPADELGRRLHRMGWWVDRPDGLDIPPAHLGRGLRNLYLSAIRRTPGLWDPVLTSSGGGGAARGIHAALDRLADRTMALIGDQPHAVVSTYPLVSQLLGRLRERGLLDVPVISYLTDPAVHPLWWHPGVDVVLAPHPCMLDQIHRLANASPGSRTTVVATAPALPRTLARPRSAEVTRTLRRELGAPPGSPLALVTAGSVGTGAVDRTAADLASWNLWPVVLCARNERLRLRIESLGVGRALGWTNDVPDLLGAADLVVHNAGGLACWEALAAGRPVVSYRVLPGHGTANAAVLEAAGVAPWARTRDDLGPALDEASLPRPETRTSRLRPDPAHVVHQCALGGPVLSPAPRSYAPSRARPQ